MSQSTADIIDLILTVGIPLLALIIGWSIGTFVERKHFASLEARERELESIVVNDLRTFPGASAPGATMLFAECVISSDYFKTFAAKLKNFLGGEVRSFRSLMERARREATVRLKQQAAAQGYNAVCNLRIETASIGGFERGNAIVMVSILISGTAYHADTPAE